MNDNKKQKVIAIKYSEGEYSPKLIAKGENEIANKIIALAKKENIPILEKKEAVDILYNIGINEEIPQDLWEIVADIYLYVFQSFEQFKVSK